MNLHIKSTITLLLFAVVSVATAQRLPNVQKVSVLAPKNVKVDGVLKEWDDTFQAYNHATDIFYIVSNNDENLYLTVEATDQQIINRIVGQGLTLNIQRGGKRDKKNRISLTYPVIEKKEVLIFSFNSKKKGVIDSSAAEHAIKVANANKQLGQKAKNIQVAGIDGVDDEISVYNEFGIKAQGRVDSRMAYNMEFSIPLKYLKLSTSNGDTFSYQIVVNGVKDMRVLFGGGVLDMEPRPGLPPQMAARIEASRARARARRLQNIAPTDFWGEYTLAKK